MTSLPDSILNKVKDHLRTKGIKLWVSPYADDKGQSSGEAISHLANQISKDLKIESETLVICLNKLQRHSLERLRQNENFKKNKIATLKIKCSQKTKEKAEFELVETKLDVDGTEFKRIVTEKLRISEELKLICCGKVLQGRLPLSSQGVRHNSVILCLVIAEANRVASEEEESALKAVKRARKGAELLAEIGSESSQLAGNYDVQIADQKGQALDLPEEEKKSLTVALGLHEKGRTLVQKKNYELGLLLLLEADKEFRECRAEILDMVDNYAVLCLDIVWCYVCTKNISALPDAKTRLKDCEVSFKRSYGESLQRLLALKGSSGNEISLFVRLYLLQGIVLYHEGDHKGAIELIEKSRGYAKTVITDETKVTQMIELGFSAREARRALRASMMDVSMATQWAFQKREEHKEIKKQEKERKRIKRMQKNFGSCVNGDPINISVHDQLVNEMGFDPELMVEALKQANNDVGVAIEMIGREPDQLREAAKKNQKKHKLNALQELTSMGFNRQTARACLDHFDGALKQAADYLVDNQGIVPEQWVQELLEDTPGTSQRLTKEEEDLVRDVAQDVTKHEDQYLDVTLDEEMQLITQYLAMAASVMDR